MRIHMGKYGYFSVDFRSPIIKFAFLTTTRFALCTLCFANGYGYLWVFKKQQIRHIFVRNEAISARQVTNKPDTNELMTNEPLNQTMGIYGCIFKERLLSLPLVIAYSRFPTIYDFILRTENYMPKERRERSRPFFPAGQLRPKAGKTMVGKSVGRA